MPETQDVWIRRWLRACAITAVALLLPLASGPAAHARPAAPNAAQPALPGAASPGDAEAITPVAMPPWGGPSPAAEVALGRRLFGDARLSRGDKLACSSCHDVAAAGADAYARSPGLDGKPLRRNTPTVFNAALNFTLGWSGAYSDLETQAAAIVTDPRVMGADWGEVVRKLNADAGYRRSFVTAYGIGPTPANIVAAIAAYERTLLTPDSRLERYLAGDRAALTPAELAGYERFKQIGCVSCHQGRNVGGNLFQPFGVFKTPDLKSRGGVADPGRIEVTGRAADRYVFRVPSLRNVAVTPPYFHDGSAPTLAEAVRVMARKQLGRSLDLKDVDLIVRFLGTLTGTYAGRPLTASMAPSP